MRRRPPASTSPAIRCTNARSRAAPERSSSTPSKPRPRQPEHRRDVDATIYKLGNRSALEWILDQYKEKTPKDPTIREKFNTYRFADHKENVIDLLKRVARVSVETMAIVEAMRAERH
ncbi:MAG: type ISP restriction/modification enzyme [Rhodoplanes sp.]